MEETGNAVYFEEVFDSEIDDIWNIIFPSSHTHSSSSPAENEKVYTIKQAETTSPRRYMKFLFM